MVRPISDELCDKVYHRNFNTLVIDEVYFLFVCLCKCTNILQPTRSQHTLYQWYLEECASCKMVAMGKCARWSRAITKIIQCFLNQLRNSWGRPPVLTMSLRMTRSENDNKQAAAHVDKNNKGHTYRYLHYRSRGLHTCSKIGRVRCTYTSCSSIHSCSFLLSKPNNSQPTFY